MLIKIILTILTTNFFIKDAFAQIGLNPNRPDLPGIRPNIDDPVSTFGIVFQNVVLLFFTIGALGFIIYFLWGTVDWILSGGDKEKIAGGRKKITTAITGLVLLSLSFVIMQVLGQILGFGSLMGGGFYIPKLLP